MALVKVQKLGSKSSYVLVAADKKHKSLDDLADDFIIDLYKHHGAVLFRDFEWDDSGFAEMAERFCSHAVHNESSGRIVVDAEKNVQTVNLGDIPFSLHPEMSRLPWKPDVCFFGCKVAPVKGGETTICDGAQLVKQLPDALRKNIQDKILLYRLEANPAYLDYWFGTKTPSDEQLQSPPEDCPFEFTRHGETFVSEFKAPMLHKPMFSKSLAWGNFIFFSRYMHDNRQFPIFEDGTLIPDQLVDAVSQVANKLERPVKWKQHDLLMLDNTRFMHGRREILDVDHRWILTYFGFLKFAKLKAGAEKSEPWRDNDTWNLKL